MKASAKTSGLFSVLAISAISLEAVGGFVTNSATAASINALLVTLLAYLATWVTNISFSHKDLFSVLKGAYGRALSFAAGLFIFAVTVCHAAVRLDMFSRVIGEFVLCKTPLAVIGAVFALCAFCVSYNGIEAISRYSTFVLVVFGAFLAVIFAFSASEVRISNICPVLGKGGFGGVFGMMYIFADVIYAYLGSAQGGKNAIRSVTVGGIAAVAVTLFYTLCVAYPVSARYPYPLYTLAAFANSSVIFQRLDILVFAVWMLGGFVTVGALCLFASRIFARVFALSDARALSGVVVVIVFALAFGFNVSSRLSFWLMTALTFGFLPFSSIVYKIRGGKNE